MSDDYNLQVSIKTPAQTLINVRGDTSSEIEDGLRIIQDLAGTIVATESMLAGAGAAAPLIHEGTPAAVPAPVAAGGGAPPAYNPPAPADAAPPPHSCPHGARVWKTGSSKNGPWGAWFCALPKGSPGVCDPDWDRSYGK